MCRFREARTDTDMQKWFVKPKPNKKVTKLKLFSLEAESTKIWLFLPLSFFEKSKPYECQEDLILLFRLASALNGLLQFTLSPLNHSMDHQDTFLVGSIGTVDPM